MCVCVYVPNTLCVWVNLPPVNNLACTLSAQPIHWVYQEDALAKAVDGVNPEFLPKSVNPFYTQITGQQSPYGDLLVVMLESLVACKGNAMIVNRLFDDRLWLEFRYWPRFLAPYVCMGIKYAVELEKQSHVWSSKF